MPLDLAEENQRLRRELDVLLTQAHRNQSILRRHHQADLRFIAADGFERLIESIFDTLVETSELDVVTLALFDGDNLIRDMTSALAINLDDFPNLLFFNGATDLGPLRTRLTRPVLGAFDAVAHGHLFPAQVLTPKTVAIVPLIRHDKLIGCLGMGSLDESRFVSAMASDFIEHMASIVVICIDNVISHERLKQIGLTDPLTGVHNRRYAEQRLHEEIGRSRRSGHALSCLYIDIDHFKKINDSVGHQCGDQVLCEVAARIKAELRVSDALGRFGGEEFIVLLVDADVDNAHGVAQRILSGISERTIDCAGHQALRVTVSIGIAHMLAPDAAKPVDVIAQELIERADRALYQAKGEGRDRIVLHG